LQYRGRGERLWPLIISIRLRQIQPLATGFVASIINTNQRVNCGPGPQVWSADYTYAGPQVRRPHFTRARHMYSLEVERRRRESTYGSCLGISVQL